MRNFLLHSLFLIGIIAALIHFVYQNGFLLMFVAGSGFSLLLINIYRLKKAYLSTFFFIALLGVVYLINTVYYQNIYNINEILLLISHLGYGLYLVENKNAIKIVKIIYISIVIYLVGFLINGGNLDDISHLSSANIVNYIFLAISILYTGLYYHNYNRILVIPSIASVIVSFLSLGRAGIVVSLFLCLGVLALKYKEKLNKFSLGVLIIVLSLSSFYIYEIIVSLVSNITTKFGQRDTFIEDSPRALIWKAYAEEINIERLIFGFGDNQHYFAGYTNIHNSFLDIHYTFGIGGIFIIIILLVTLAYFLFKKELLYFILFFCLLLRGNTDTVMLVGVYDFIIVYFVLLVIKLSGSKLNDGKINC